MSDKPSSGIGMPTPAEIEGLVETAGVTKASTPRGRAFLLAVLAGLFIGLGASFMLVVRSDGQLPFAASVMLGALAFCLGLFLVLVAGAELFTGNCLMVCGAISGRYGWGSVLKSWLTVYAGNALGAFILVGLMYTAEFLSLNEGAVAATALSVATSKAALAPGVAFARGILCNVLVCLAVWMGFAGRSVIDKLAAALLPVCAFVVMGFEHSIANLYFLPLGLVAQTLLPGGAGTLALSGVVCNLVFVTLGNIVGGVAVGIAYRCALVRTGTAAR